MESTEIDGSSSGIQQTVCLLRGALWLDAPEWFQLSSTRREKEKTSLARCVVHDRVKTCFLSMVVARAY